MKSSVVSGENRGSVNEILLKALQSGDKYGYEINKEIETKSGGKFFLKEASLYSGLKRLQSAGFISSYWKDGDLGIKRHYYSITEKGLEKLNSSNFTWDSSKNFLEDIFNSNSNNSNENSKTSKTNEILSKDKNFQNDNRSNDNLLKEDSLNSENNINSSVQNNSTTPKNPFQIEVSPLQQSIFDLNFSEKNKEIKTENNLNTENNLASKEYKEETKIEETKIEEKKIDESKTEEKTISSYDELIKQFSSQGYSNSLDKATKSDISSLLKKDETKINESNIVLNKEKPTLASFLNKYSQSLKNDSKETESVKIDENKTINNTNSNINNDIMNNNVDCDSNANQNEVKNVETITNENASYDNINANINSSVNNVNKNINNYENVEKNKVETIINENINNYEIVEKNTIDNINNNVANDTNTTKNDETNSNNNVDIKNIFGSLLVSNSNAKSEENSSEDSTNSTENLKNFGENKSEKLQNDCVQNEESSQKEELPRINVDDDVNVTLDASKKSYYFEKNESSYNYQDKIVTNQNSTNVKKYIDNVRKDSLLPRTNKFDEQVDLSGITIREYERMNNKLIKNSNYIYSNKLNFFLCLLVSIISIVESVVCFVVFGITKNLFLVEILFLSLVIVSCLALSYYFGLVYYKDKYKTKLKSTHKSAIFYLILIFVVCLIIAVCVNIFEGMNENNSNYFALKICLETLIFLNIPLLGVFNKLFYKLKFFTN